MSESQGPTTKETPQDRFERWALNTLNLIVCRDFVGRYVNIATATAWEAWQAAFDAGAKSVVAAPQLEKYDLELNQERLVSAVMCGLEEMNRRGCQELAAVQWFQAGYREAMEHLRTADEEEVFKVREGKPTLTGKNATRLAGAAALPSAPEPTTRFKDYYGDRWVPTIQRAIKFMSDCELTEFTREKTLNCMTAFALEMAVASPPVPSKEPK